MGSRRQPSDYEPVAPLRPTPAGRVEEHAAPTKNDWLAPRLAPAQAPTGSSDYLADPVSGDGANASDDAPGKAQAAAGFPRAPLQRGHALTFAGLFLFTFVLYVRPYELIGALAGFTSMAFWIAVCTLAVFLPAQLSLEGNLTARPREVNLLLLFCLAGLISTPLAEEPARSWYALVDLLKVALMFVVMINAVRTERRLRLLLLLALAVSCVLSAAAISDYRAGNLVMRSQRIAGTIKGLFENPNDLALHLVTMIPIAAALMFGARSLTKKLAYAACALLMAGGIVATFSRAGFIGLVAASLMLIWKIGRRNRLAICAIALVVVPLFVALAPSSYGGRLSDTSDDSAITRRDDLQKSLFVTLRHPLFGIGMDNYVLHSNTEHATHNAYTQVSAEMGVAALVVYVLFVFSPFRRLRRIDRAALAAPQRSRFFYLAVGLQASLVGYAVTSFFASVAYVWYVYYLVGYAVCLQRIYEASPEAVADAAATRDADSAGAVGQNVGAAGGAFDRAVPFSGREALDA